jgi:phosphohistidine phosphatase
MASEKLASIPEVEIDSDGTFKYVLIKVYGAKGSTSPDEAKTIVRGFKWGDYHGKKQNTVFNQVSIALTAWLLVEFYFHVGSVL